MVRSRLRKMVVAAPLALASMFALSGCVENRSSIFVAGVIAPTDDCTFTADANQVMLFSGAYYYEDGGSYTAAVLVGNQLTRLGDPTLNRSETSFFQIEGAEVTLLSGDGASTVAEFSTVTTATVPPGTGPNPGYASVSVTMIPPGTSASDGDSFVAEFRVFGTSLGGAVLESGPATFRIDARAGSLADFRRDGTCSACNVSSDYRCEFD